MRFLFMVAAMLPPVLALLAGCADQPQSGGPRYSDDALAASHRLGLPLGDEGLEDGLAEAAAALDPGDAWIKPVGPRNRPPARAVASSRPDPKQSSASADPSSSVDRGADEGNGAIAAATGSAPPDSIAPEDSTAPSGAGKTTKSSSKRKPMADADRPDPKRGDDDASSRGDRGGDSDAQPAEVGWTILLGSFTGPEHEQQARRALGQYQAALPDLADAFITQTPRGSMVAYGSYSAPSDAAAQADLQRIKSIAVGQSRPFARVIMSPLTSPRPAGRAGSRFDLMTARDQHPDVNPLYTLQVAVWGDFESGTLSLAEIHRRAEDYAAKLRGQGVEAYVYHNDLAKLSMVTVGVFDSSSIDAEAGLMSPELATLRKRFPAHLVNGEEFHEPINRNLPNRGTRLQEPRLVEVPLR